MKWAETMTWRQWFCTPIDTWLRSSFPLPTTITDSHDRNPPSNKWLPAGQFHCRGKHRMRVKPVRNIADWGERRVRKFPADLVEPPDWCVDMPEVWEKIRDPQPLRCGALLAVPIFAASLVRIASMK